VEVPEQRGAHKKSADGGEYVPVMTEAIHCDAGMERKESEEHPKRNSNLLLERFHVIRTVHLSLNHPSSETTSPSGQHRGTASAIPIPNRDSPRRLVKPLGRTQKGNAATQTSVMGAQ
jgi:hypothetical protein